MVALPSVFGRDEDDRAAEPPLPKPNPADWLPLQQGACELNVSISTARRMIRKGKLRNRIVPRPGGFAYLVYLPNSRHANGLGGHACRQLSPAPDDAREPRDLGACRQSRNGAADGASDAKVRLLEQQVEHLSEALARALKTKQRALPEGMGQPTLNPGDPYARYRWLARRKRWWPL
ncbi:MAG: hypothetical protein WD359_03870 [Dehalococcoidia bacterium]